MRIKGIISAAALFWGAAVDAGAAESLAGGGLVSAVDGSRVAVASEDGQVRVVSEDGAVVFEFTLGTPAEDASFSPDAAKLAVCLAGGGLAVADLQAKRVQRFPEEGTSCRTPRWGRQGGRVFYASTARDPELPGSRSLRSVDLAAGRAATLHEMRGKRPVMPPPPPPAPLPNQTSAPAPAAPAPAPERRNNMNLNTR